jgi:hypothetical protein
MFVFTMRKRKVGPSATCAGDVVPGQDLLVVAEAEQQTGVLVAPAALSLAMTAVQLHLDL